MIPVYNYSKWNTYDVFLLRHHIKRRAYLEYYFDTLPEDPNTTVWWSTDLDRVVKLLDFLNSLR